MGWNTVWYIPIREGLFYLTWKSFALSRFRTQFSLKRSSQPILTPQSFSLLHLFVAGVLQRRCQGGRGGLSQDRQSWPTFSPSATFLSQLLPFLRSTFSSTILLGILHPVCWILLSATRIGGDNSAILQYLYDPSEGKHYNSLFWVSSDLLPVPSREKLSTEHVVNCAQTKFQQGSGHRATLWAFHGLNFKSQSRVFKYSQGVTSKRWILKPSISDMRRNTSNTQILKLLS